MLKKDKTSGKKNKILFLFICIILILFFFRGIINSGVDKIGTIFFPIQKTIYNTGNYFKETSYAVTEYKHILEENKRLKNENVKLDMAIEFNKTLVEENKRLQELLKMKETVPLDLRVAKVNFRSPSNLYERFYINLGTKDGMQKNMIVLAGKTLIGKIGKVYDEYSLVDMVTGENFNLSVLTESQMLGIAKGSDEGSGELYFEPNTFENTLQLGEKVYTSGISEIYPKGLYVGYISEIDQDESQIFRSIKIKTDLDILNLNEVLVIVPKEEKEK
ncbi:rod shape-determining protein MreC [uncultured Fusobacterium sp.]|uniref:rod shape-determining protein MreC n=1 Tax=uncultured Fusobacterium sp. TaxID=159267 RepID=UPI0025E3234F|nr:rod shape-determining protein MreC [uncultured Fusobacterium sp.]